MTRILIVDDDAKIRSIYKKLLTQEGYEVLDAGNWEDTTFALLQDKHIDLILLDIDMPVLGGASWFDLIRLHLPLAKVIVASVYGIQDQKRLIEKADDYFDKSEGTWALLKKIKEMFNGHAAQTSQKKF